MTSTRSGGPGHRQSAATDIEVVLFDADGVFQRTPPATWHEINAFTPKPDKAAFREAILAAEAACIANGTELDSELVHVLEKWQCSGSVAAFLALWYTIELDLAVLELVGSLRSAGILCCTASNQLRGRAAHMSGTLGLGRRFDREFYAYALGALKPHPDFHRGILSQLGGDPSNPLHRRSCSERRDSACTGDEGPPLPGVCRRRCIADSSRGA